ETGEVKMSAVRSLIVATVAAAAVAVPLTAHAQPPTVELVPTNDVQVLSGPDSPCPFDVVFTGTGTVAITTFYDNDGNPIRQSLDGALPPTISSAWHTLVSNGPAPVHVDLTTGQMVVTGMEFAFHLPGDGIVLGQSGRLTLAADNSQVAFSGHSVLD